MGSEMSYPPIAQCFIEKDGNNIESKEKMETNSSLCSCEKGHFQIVQLFNFNWERYYIEAKQKDGNQPTPLHFACENGHLPIVKYIIEKGAKIEAKDRN